MILLNSMDKIWNIIDSNIDAIDYTQIEDSFVCDACDDQLSNQVPFYNANHFFLQLCEGCHNKNIFKTLVIIEDIDRSMYSIEEKPLIWPCIRCNTKLGGGYKWKLLKYQAYLHAKTMCDICIDCYNKDPDLIDYNNSGFHKISGNFVVCERTNPIFINISNVQNRIIPNQLINDVTIDRANTYTELLESIVSIDVEFGSVKEWTMFTDLYEWPLINAQTALLINCSTTSTIDTNHKIASLLFDDHGRVAIDIIFDSLDEYFKIYNEWNDNFTTFMTNESEYDNLLKEVENDLRKNFKCDDDKFAKICKEFSGYIRIKKNLGYYYG